MPAVFEPEVRISHVSHLTGPSAQVLFNNEGDTGYLRPFKEMDKWNRPTGRSVIEVNSRTQFDKEGNPAKEFIYTNTPALLRREDWLRIDREIQWAARLRLSFWGTIYGQNPYNIPDGLSVIAIQHAVASGDAEAVISMDGMRRSERARPVLDVGVLPLPIIHSDGEFSLREMAVSKRSGMPLDTTQAKICSTKVAETVEKLALGLLPAYTYGGGTIYGARNFPSRETVVLTSPLTGGYTPQVTYNEVLSMIQTLEDNIWPGPYVLFVSTGWGRYMDQDYNQTYPTEATLRKKLQNIEKIVKVVTVDYLPDYEMILMQMSSDVVEGVQGMPLRTIQWDAGGGMATNFKVMCIQVPRFRANFRGKTGIIHGTATLGGTTTTTTSTTTTTTTTT